MLIDSYCNILLAPHKAGAFLFLKKKIIEEFEIENEYSNVGQRRIWRVYERLIRGQVRQEYLKIVQQ